MARRCRAQVPRTTEPRRHGVCNAKVACGSPRWNGRARQRRKAVPESSERGIAWTGKIGARPCLRGVRGTRLWPDHACPRPVLGPPLPGQRSPAISKNEIFACTCFACSLHSQQTQKWWQWLCESPLGRRWFLSFMLFVASAFGSTGSSRPVHFAVTLLWHTRVSPAFQHAVVCLPGEPLGIERTMP